MLKKLLVGPAGCGKTHQVLLEFHRYLELAPDPLARDAFLILPSAEHVDRMTTLALQSGLTGFFHHRITTFSSLLRSLFFSSDYAMASSSSRFLIMKEILQQNTWPHFEEVQQTSGFGNLMLHLITELKESLLTAEVFREKMNRLKIFEPELAPKYEALAQIYEKYQARMNEEKLHDPQDLYWHFSEAIHGETKHRFKSLWLDGFFDFSPMQLEYLRILSNFSEEITVTLTQDPSGGRAALFSAVQETAHHLEGLGFKKIFLEPLSQRAKNEALRHLERHLFSGEKIKKALSPGKALAIFDAVGMQGEIEMIAREIRRMVREDQIRYSDCAVLMRHISGYEPLIHSVFQHYDIPVEIHERERTKLSPLVQSVVFLFRIFREDWKRESLFNFLKSSYVKLSGEGASLELIYELENAASRNGIFQGRDLWLSEWKEGTEKTLRESFHTQKNELLAPLAVLQAKLSRPLAPSKMVQILDRAISGFQIAELELEEITITRRESAALMRLEALFEEIRHHFTVRGRETVSFEEFSDHFFKLVELDLFSIHHRDKNRVQVYGISMARQKEYQAVFVSGLLEKIFPVLIKEDPLLSDWERQQMNRAGSPRLAEKLPRQNLERYLFYLAVTRARDRVILTYPRLDREGKESLPSFYVDEVRRLFTDQIAVQQQNLAHPYPRLEEVQNSSELETAVIGGLWHGTQENEPVLLALTNELLGYRSHREAIQKALYQISDRLENPEISHQDLFRNSRTSATSLEEYAKCPFKYYSNRVLKLKDPEEDMNVRRKGTMMHHILEIFFSRRLHEPVEFSPEQILKFIEKELAVGLVDHPLIYPKAYQYELAKEEMKDMLAAFIEKEQARLRTSPLQPAFFEYGFGSGSAPAAEALSVEIDGRKIQLTGIIDRIDIDKDRQFALIVDYKRSAKFSRSNMDLGIALQLPIYLKAAETFLGLKPVGGELYSIKDCKSAGFYHEEHASGLKSLSHWNLKFDPAEFEAMMQRSFDFVRRFMRGLMNQEIPVRPRSCDSSCPYPSVCRIEKWKLDSILEEIKEEDQKITESKNCV